MAADPVHAATCAIRGRFPVDDVVDTVPPFPPFSEALKVAAESFGHDMSRMACCVEWPMLRTR